MTQGKGFKRVIPLDEASQHTQGELIAHGGKYFQGWNGDLYIFEKGKTVETGQHIARLTNPLKVEQDKRPNLSELDAIQKLNESREVIEANAARIVKAWNCHDDLLEALRDAENAIMCLLPMAKGYNAANSYGNAYDTNARMIEVCAERMQACADAIAKAEEK